MVFFYEYDGLYDCGRVSGLLVGIVRLVLWFLDIIRLNICSRTRLSST